MFNIGDIVSFKVNGEKQVGKITYVSESYTELFYFKDGIRCCTNASSVTNLQLL